MSMLEDIHEYIKEQKMLMGTWPTPLTLTTEEIIKIEQILGSTIKEELGVPETIITDKFTEVEKLHIRAVKIALITCFKSTKTYQYLLDAGVLSTGSTYISGGCIGSLLRSEDYKDIDLFFNDFDTMQTAINTVLKYPDEILEIDDFYNPNPSPNAKKPAINEHAITMKDKVQVTRYYGHPNSVREGFDYVHCMPYLDWDKQRLHISKEQYVLIMGKKLKINPKFGRTPDSFRTAKLLQNGWRF